MRRAMALGAAVLGCLSVCAAAQILPANAGLPVQVHKPQGEFARKLHGAVMPTGKGWRAVTDREKRLQIMVPERWKVHTNPEANTLIRATPPGHEKDPKAVLMVILSEPSDADPLEVDEPFALGYAEELAQDPALLRLDFKPTDSGFVIARGLKFALAGGTMVYQKKETFQQQQLIYIGEDRIVSVQFTAAEKEFPKWADDVARIFASYQTLGSEKLSGN